MISIRDLDANSVELKWRLEGVLSLPGRPRIKAYTGTTTYDPLHVAQQLDALLGA